MSIMSKSSTKNTKIVGLDGPPCPRCKEPTQIREHKEITKKELSNLCYFKRWYICMNKFCKTTAIMPDRFRVWNIQEPTKTEPKFDKTKYDLSKPPWEE